jgi:hypothetical protein
MHGTEQKEDIVFGHPLEISYISNTCLKKCIIPITIPNINPIIKPSIKVFFVNLFMIKYSLHNNSM